MPDLRDDFPRPPSTDEWHVLKAQVAESTRAREKYVPMIERMDERQDAIHESIDKLNATLERLVEKIGPLINEREMVLKFVRFIGGIVVGIAGSVVTWRIIESLK